MADSLYIDLSNYNSIRMMRGRSRSRYMRGYTNANVKLICACNFKGLNLCIGSIDNTEYIIRVQYNGNKSDIWRLSCYEKALAASIEYYNSLFNKDLAKVRTDITQALNNDEKLNSTPADTSIPKDDITQKGSWLGLPPELAAERKNLAAKFSVYKRRFDEAKGDEAKRRIYHSMLLVYNEANKGVPPPESWTEFITTNATLAVI